MLSPDNKYTVMQRNQYNNKANEMQIEDHYLHNDNPDYHGVLLHNVIRDSGGWTDKVALDFGCGCGRNVENMLGLASWKEVWGCDISIENITYCDKTMPSRYGGKIPTIFQTVNGVDLQPLPSNHFDFIMSTIVLQHICVYDIRFSILTDIFRVMAKGGLFSFQMGFGGGNKQAVPYHANYYSATGTNSICDTRVENEKEIILDLQAIGFTDIITQITDSWRDQHSQWIYVEARKS